MPLAERRLRALGIRGGGPPKNRIVPARKEARRDILPDCGCVGGVLVGWVAGWEGHLGEETVRFCCLEVPCLCALVSKILSNFYCSMRATTFSASAHAEVTYGHANLSGRCVILTQAIAKRL